MEVLGEGSYGCVVRPPAKCKSREHIITQGDASVSKLFVDKAEFRREVKAAKAVSKIDAESNTILIPSKYCSTNLKNVTVKGSLWECEAIRDLAFESGNTPIYQLMMPYGGVRLDHFVKSHKMNKKDFVNMMIPVVEGITRMAAKKYCHQDIKSSNILVRPGRRAIIIDYSLMKKFKYIYAEDNMSRLRHTYYPYPPEFKVVYGISAGRTDHEIIESIKKNANHFNVKYGTAIISFWGDKNIQQLCTAMRNTKNLDAYLTKSADRIDVYSVGAVFIQLEDYLIGSGLSTKFKKMYKEIVKRMIALDPYDRIPPNELLEKINILKKL